MAVLCPDLTCPLLISLIPQSPFSFPLSYLFFNRFHNLTNMTQLASPSDVSSNSAHCPPQNTSDPMVGPKNSLEMLGKQETMKGSLHYICAHHIRNCSHFQCTECRYVGTWAHDIGHISQDLRLNHVVSCYVPGALLGVRHSTVSQQTWP